MIYLTLFLVFFKISMLSVGGAYSVIPLIQDEIISRGWASEEDLLNFIALSESTPGPLMVNLATYIGADHAGLLGALASTTGIIMPAFLIFWMIARFGRGFLNFSPIQGAIKGLAPILMGVIFATGLTMLFHCVVSEPASIDQRSLILAVILIALMIAYKIWKKKPLSPIKTILLSALFGICLF